MNNEYHFIIWLNTNMTSVECFCLLKFYLNPVFVRKHNDNCMVALYPKYLENTYNFKIFKSEYDKLE